MKRLLFTMISFILAYNLFKPSLFASDNALVLESSQEPSIYSGHHSHNSHHSHVSHYSHYSCTYTIKTDSIGMVSTSQLDLIKKNLCNDSVTFITAFVSNSEVKSNKDSENNFSGNSLFIITKEVDNDSDGNESFSINFITIPLEISNTNFFCDFEVFDSKEECDEFINSMSPSIYFSRRSLNAKETKNPWMFNL